MAETGTDDKVQQLVFAASTGDFGAIRILCEQGTDVNGSYKGITALFAAAAKGYVVTVQTLLDCGANPNAPTQPRKLTALQVSSLNGYIETVDLLLEHEADPNLANHAGETPLHSASVNGHATIAELLIEHGALIDAQNIEGDTALHDAARFNRPETVALLLSKGADPNITNNKNQRALDVAINVDENIVALLRKAMKITVVPSSHLEDGPEIGGF